ncbi:MAG: hypothetical protein ABW250_02555 [Pyrinomonadaceae bacterium]
MKFLSRRKKDGGPAAEAEAPARPHDQRRYGRSDIVRVPVGARAQLVYSRLDGASHMLPNHLAQILEQCAKFRTLGEHARHLSADPGLKMGVGTPPEEQLRRLVGLGLLVPEDELASVAEGASAGREESARVSTLGVVTRDRPESLRRCLDSYVENLRRYGRQTGLVVVDGSADADAGEQTRRSLQSLKARYGVDISYAGHDEKVSFAAALAAEGGLPPDVVEFALFDVEACGNATGANRNALFLHAVGELLLSVDDDTVCRLAAGPQPDASEGCLVSPADKFMEHWFFPDHEAALRAARFVDEDVLALHEQVLGKTLSACVQEFGERAGVEFGRVTPRLVGDLRSGGRVLVSLTGIVGDAGSDIPPAYHVLSAESRQRLTLTEPAYLSARKSRELLRVVSRPCITSNPSCMTTALGYDQRRVLPPFMPVMRGQDDVFGMSLRSCFEQGYFGHLPRAILHKPEERRAYAPESVHEQAAEVRMCSVVVACLTSHQFPPGALDPAERLRALGRHLAGIGSMTQPDYEEFVRLQLWRLQGANISILEQYVASAGAAPRFWVEAMGAYLEHLRRSLSAEGYFVPKDLARVKGAAEARALSQRLVLRFGRLLEHWPEMVEAARRLREKGRRLAVVV